MKSGRPLSCLRSGCAEAVHMDPLPDDPLHIAVRHGDGEAVKILPCPLTDEHVEILTDYIALWLGDVHAYEDGQPAPASNAR
jgi:hypothetical protein